jgi:hypothetical protein
MLLLVFCGSGDDVVDGGFEVLVMIVLLML